MSIGAGWYATNRARNYPLSDTSSAVDDYGRPLPESVLADLSIRYTPKTDEKLRISHLRVEDAVSVIFSEGDVAVATATVPYDNFGLPVPLTPLTDDAAGFVVVSETDNKGGWTFSHADQSGLSDRIVLRLAAPAKTPRLSRDGVQPGTQSITRLLGTGDVVATRETRVIDGEEVPVVVLSLRDSVDLLTQYAGVCGQRVESRTCDNPQPIETVNNVQADCCNRIFVEFKGCAEMTPMADPCGVLVQCDLDVDESCPDRSSKLPDDDGNLPDDTPEDPANDPGDDCEPMIDDAVTSSTQEF